MYFKLYFLKKDKEIDSSVLKLEVVLDILDDTNHAQLMLSPIDEDVQIVQETYDDDKKLLGVFNVGVFKQDVSYNKEHNLFEFGIKTSFDVFIFNICALLDIGKLTIDENVKLSETGFAPIKERVKSISLTLEEICSLNGFLGKFSIIDNSIDFKGIVLNLQAIHESVSDGEHIPDVKSNLLKRSENLYLWER